MLKEEEYRLHAAELIGLAHCSEEAGEKIRRLRIAEAWLGLADRVRRAADNLHQVSADASGQM